MEKKKITFEIEQKLKIYTNEAHPDFCLDPEYGLTWDEQFEEFKEMFETGGIDEKFIDFAIGLGAGD